MDVNGEAIYGAPRRAPSRTSSPGAASRSKPGRLYLHFFAWPRGGSAIHGLARSAYSRVSARRPRAGASPWRERSPGTRPSITPSSPSRASGGARTSACPWSSCRSRAGPGGRDPPRAARRVRALPSFMAALRGPSSRGVSASAARLHGRVEEYRQQPAVAHEGARARASRRYAFFGQGGVLRAGPGAPRLELDGPAQASLRFPVLEHGRLAPTAQYFPEIVTRAGEIGLPAPGIYEVSLVGESERLGPPRA